MTAWVVAGPPGAGKSTLGAALAHSLGAVLLDLDTITNPLLDALGEQLNPGGHWNDDTLREVVRPARYAALRSVAHDQAQLGHDVVLVAPFTAELTGGEPWHQLVRAVGPELPHVLWLTAPADVRAQRVADRGASRDSGRPNARPEPPQVPYTSIDTTLDLEEQLALAREKVS